MNLNVKNSSDNHQKCIHCIPNCTDSPTVLCSFCCYQSINKKSSFKKDIRSKWQRCIGKSPRHFFISLFFTIEMAGLPLKLNTNQPFGFWLKYQSFWNLIELLMMPKTKIYYQNPIYGVVIEFEQNLTNYRLIKDN